MIKRILLFAMLLTGAVQAWAGDQLHVHTQTGGEVVYDFADRPVITFQADQMMLTTAAVTVVYPMSEVTSFTFTHTQTESLQQISSSEPTGDATVRIYTLQGTLVQTCAAHDQTSRIAISQLPAGTYIVRSQHRSYKVTISQ